MIAGHFYLTTILRYKTCFMINRDKPYDIVGKLGIKVDKLKFWEKSR